jgi:hypothetical protein
LANLLVAGSMGGQRKEALAKALGAAGAQAPFTQGGDAETKVRSALHLLMCSPEYQLA